MELRNEERTLQTELPDADKTMKNEKTQIEEVKNEEKKWKEREEMKE
jgi:hypothetical protein